MKNQLKIHENIVILPLKYSQDFNRFLVSYSVTTVYKTECCVSMLPLWRSSKITFFKSPGQHVLKLDGTPWKKMFSYLVYYLFFQEESHSPWPGLQGDWAQRLHGSTCAPGPGKGCGFALCVPNDGHGRGWDRTYLYFRLFYQRQHHHHCAPTSKEIRKLKFWTMLYAKQQQQQLYLHWL